MNRSNLNHPTMVVKIKAAIVEATRLAHQPEASQALGHALVRNRRGLVVLHVFAERGKGFTVETHSGRNVTDDAMFVLREYHAALAAGRSAYPIILKNVRLSYPGLRPRPRASSHDHA